MGTANSKATIRKFPRIDLTEKVYFEGGHILRAARWTDISPGGIYVETRTPLSIGDSVKLKIRLPGDTKSYLAAGIVRHSLRLVGMGLEFTDVPPTLHETLHQILSEQKFLES